MPGLAIVAIPSENDPVWHYSSEKVPHLTLLYLGDKKVDPNAVERIEQYLDHVIETSLCQFGMSVDRRGELGDKKADVLFFKQDYTKKLKEFRQYLLYQPDIRELYDSAEQFPEWTPHLTMGYPEDPAKPDDREYSGFSWVNFDLVALWTGEYEGTDFRLDDYDYSYGSNVAYYSDLSHQGAGLELDDNSDLQQAVDLGADFLEHFGIKGMRWGVKGSDTSRKASAGDGHASSEDHDAAVVGRVKIKQHGTKALSNKELQSVISRMNLEQQYSNISKSKSKVRKGHEAVKTVLGVAGSVSAAVALVSSPAGKIIRKSVVSAIKNAPDVAKNVASVLK